MVQRMGDNAVSVSGPDQRSVEWYASGKVPAIIDRAGATARKRFLEFFPATIRNENTRMAYARAVGSFFAWCQSYRLELLDIEPIHVAAYIERHLGAPLLWDSLESRRTRRSPARGSCSSLWTSI